MIKNLLLAPLLFSSPVLAEKERIYYVHTRPPFSYSGTIGDDGFFYYFTNSADRFNDEICKIRIDGACFVKTNVPAKIVKEGIMKTPNMYWCSEAVIQKAKKVQPPSPSNRFGYGICTENGWVFE
ncbi:MAG: hypothetical protein JJ840_09695 [Prochlorococcus marinus CUG1431]|uniref:Uncharacterized protein n=1 Tax=Prochlorococcus marinus CUG1433 TaxID=2774506 RepID=A0A9D9BY00_PROMR|nr:hypothetical protein [Prochlorococcus marinus CUG1433]MBO6981624.1 hypothetical protein [Prochlorococcus marinus CUG1431]